MLSPRGLQRRPLQSLHVHVERALLKRHRKRLRGYALQPRQQTQVRITETHAAVQQPAEAHLLRLRLGTARGLRLTVIHAGLVQDALNDELDQPVVLGARVRVGVRDLPITRKEFGDEWVHFAETLHARVARVPVLVLEVIGEARQGQQEAHR